MRTQEEDLSLAKLEVDEGFCVKSVLSRLKDKETNWHSTAALLRGEIIDTVSGASRFKTGVLGEEMNKTRKQKTALFTADTSCTEESAFVYPESVSYYDMLLEMASALSKACIYIICFQRLVSLIKKTEQHDVTMSKLGMGFSGLFWYCTSCL